jgi:hypothetical protein
VPLTYPSFWYSVLGSAKTNVEDGASPVLKKNGVLDQEMTMPIYKHVLGRE